MCSPRQARDVRAAALLVLVLAAWVIPGSKPWSGPVLLSLTASHGVHVADLGVVALAAVVAVAAYRLGVLQAPAVLVRPGRLLPAT